MNVMSKQSSEINEPIAHFELNMTNTNKKNPQNNLIAKFEMSKGEVTDMLTQLNAIQQCFGQLTASANSAAPSTQDGEIVEIQFNNHSFTFKLTNRSSS